MTDLTTPSRKLTHNGIRKLIDAAVDAADEMGVPMGIAVANDGARIVGYLLMDGARILAQDSASAKAMTAASHRMPTHAIDYNIGMGLVGFHTGKGAAAAGRRTHHYRRILRRRDRLRVRHGRTGSDRRQGRARGDRRGGSR